MIILPDVDLMPFITFITSCKTSSIKIWFMLAAGLVENLIQVVFHQPFVIQHARTSDVPASFLSSQSHEPFESESSHSHLKFCRVMTWSSRVTRMVESLRVIGLQARVNVESYKISSFSYIFLAVGRPVDLQWL